ncbi:MAG: hypothetical protein AB7F98_09470 [Novosphingobium sp.]
MSDVIDWIAGDAFGFPIPAHVEALREGGCRFLTKAFHAAGSLGNDNEVTSITRFEPCPGGGTGSKLYLSLTYALPGPPEDLFVKFSRAFGNEIRDRQKIQMEGEVWLALLSRQADFPISVPRCMFADYHHDSGTGILITQQVRFGVGGVEPNHVKCLDRDLPDPLGHYHALLRALARLAGAYHGGRFPERALAQLRQGALGVAEREPYSPEQLERRIARWGDYTQAYANVVPAHIRDPAFLDRFADQAPRFCGHEKAIEAFLNAPSDFVALSHWNANTDNAWFWTGADGKIDCGLFDWGNARVMNLGVALAGCFYGAEPDFLIAHLDDLIEGFCAEFVHAAGRPLDPQELKHHLALQLACSGLVWMIDAPTVIQRLVPDLAQVPDRYDPRVFDNELIRTQIHMSAVWLTLWRELNFGAQLDRFLAR